MIHKVLREYHIEDPGRWTFDFPDILVCDKLDMSRFFYGMKLADCIRVLHYINVGIMTAVMENDTSGGIAPDFVFNEENTLWPQVDPALAEDALCWLKRLEQLQPFFYGAIEKFGDRVRKARNQSANDPCARHFYNFFLAAGSVRYALSGMINQLHIYHQQFPEAKYDEEEFARAQALPDDRGMYRAIGKYCAKLWDALSELISAWGAYEKEFDADRVKILNKQ